MNANQTAVAQPSVNAIRQFIDRISAKLNLEWKSAAQFMGVAVTGTIIGDTVYQFATEAFWQWGVSTFAFRLLLIAVAYLLTAGLVVRLIDTIRGNGEAQVQDLTDIASSPALIVFVSAPFRKPGEDIDVERLVAKKAVDLFRKPPHNPLRHVFLIHSEQSEEHARLLHDVIEKSSNHKIDAHMRDLKADFNRLKDMREVSERAVSQAMGFVRPQDIVIDVTGGTGIATAAAVLSVMNKDVSISFIPRQDGAEFGTEIKRVDARWTTLRS